MAQEFSAHESTFLDQLIAHGLLIPSGVQGIYGKSGVMENVICRIDELLTDIGREMGADIMRFPPVMNRATVEQTGYMKSFPQLLGSVHSFTGKHREHQQLLNAMEEGQDWSQSLPSTQDVLIPAACYPVYPTLAGTLPEDGRLVDVCCFCFRHEPSPDPARMQSFRQHEFIRIADAHTVEQWHGEWIKRGDAFLRSLGLEPVVAPANDPFFGPGGRLLAASQQEQQLKFELLSPINSSEHLTAISSCNYHQDHFASKFGIYTASGEIAHTSCIGFGLERIALALFRKHGLDTAEWPVEVRKRLAV